MATTLGLLHLDVKVFQATNLKDKRRVLKSFKDRIVHRFNVSIAEVEGLDLHRSATLVVAAVGNDRRRIESILQRIVNAADAHRDMVLVDHDVEWL